MELSRENLRMIALDCFIAGEDLIMVDGVITPVAEAKNLFNQVEGIIHHDEKCYIVKINGNDTVLLKR